MENRETDFQPQERQPEQNQVPAGTGATGTPPPTPAKWSNRKVFVITGALFVICLCVGISGLVVAKLMGEINAEGPKVESVIDEYFSAMADQDAMRAYILLSTRAKRNVPLSDVEKLLEGNNYVVFEGYQSLTITDFTINFTSDPDPNMPQGEVAEAQGMTSYNGGFTGDFIAVLELEEDEWRLHGINLTVPPDKFSP